MNFKIVMLLWRHFRVKNIFWCRYSNVFKFLLATFFCKIGDLGDNILSHCHFLFRLSAAAASAVCWSKCWDCYTLLHLDRGSRRSSSLTWRYVTLFVKWMWKIKPRLVTSSSSKSSQAVSIPVFLCRPKTTFPRPRGWGPPPQWFGPSRNWRFGSTRTWTGPKSLKRSVRMLSKWRTKSQVWNRYSNSNIHFLHLKFSYRNKLSNQFMKS